MDGDVADDATVGDGSGAAPTPEPATRLIRRPCMFAVTWWLAVLVGWAVFAVGTVAFVRLTLPVVGATFVTVSLLVVLGELRPIVTSSLNEVPVPFSTAFLFAALYLWGLPAAIVLTGVSVLASELARRKALWKLLFNVGQYVLCVLAAGGVLAVGGVLHAPDQHAVVPPTSAIGWMVLSWLAFHLLNLALVAGLAESDGESFADSFTEDFWYYTVSSLAVLALSPLVAVVAKATPDSWMLLPLLLLPILAVYATARTSRRTEHRSLHDDLTELPNRRLLTLRTEEALEAAARTGSSVALCLLDLDRFKEVNDTLGHHAGDALLRMVATRLREGIRPEDSVGRLGGDEFAVLLPEVRDEEAAVVVARRLLATFEAPLEVDGVVLALSASLGLAVSGPGSGTDAGLDPAPARGVPGGGFEGMLRRADVAMYTAKRSGKDLQLYLPSLDRHSAERLGASAALAAALRETDGESVVDIHLQPKVSLRDGAPVGAEALVRWHDRDRGAVPADETVALAERTGQIGTLTTVVLGRALATAAWWHREGLALPVAVNVSLRDLQDPGFLSRVLGALDEHGLGPASLVLEVTETVFADDLDRAVRVLRHLREAGVGISLDDFGTGYSSLSLLERLPVTELKIDRTFVARLDAGGDRGMVAAVLALAHGLDLTVVAEGVETESAYRRLRDLGCDVVQGYLLARPLPVAAATAWLRERTPAGPWRPGVAGSTPDGSAVRSTGLGDLDPAARG